MFKFIRSNRRYNDDDEEFLLLLLFLCDFNCTQRDLVLCSCQPRVTSTFFEKLCCSYHHNFLGMTTTRSLSYLNG